MITMGFKEKEDRFIISHKESEGLSKGEKIIVDAKTGVNYLFAWDGYAGGLTVLVDKDGKPIVTHDYL
jgi:hypothetical protein